MASLLCLALALAPAVAPVDPVAPAEPVMTPAPAPSQPAAPGPAGTPARAPEVTPTSGPTSAGTSTGTSTDAAPERWITRLRPRRHMVELGPLIGTWRPPANHNLISAAELVDRNWVMPRIRPALDLGLQLDYLAVRYLALGLRGSLAHTHTAEGGAARMYRVVAAVSGQLPLAAVAPFVTVGLGLVGVNGDALGRDANLAYVVGGGLKLYAHRYVALQFSALDHVVVDDGTYYAHHVLVSGGLSITLLRSPRA